MNRLSLTEQVLDLMVEGVIDEGVAADLMKKLAGFINAPGLKETMKAVGEMALGAGLTFGGALYALGTMGALEAMGDAATTQGLARDDRRLKALMGGVAGVRLGLGGGATVKGLQLMARGYQRLSPKVRGLLGKLGRKEDAVAWAKASDEASD